MSTDTKKCVVHTAPKSIPIIYDSPNLLTVANITLWEYFTTNCAEVNKDKITTTTLIPTLTSGFQDELVRNWYDTNCKDFAAMTIAEFAAEMHTEFLNEHWAIDLCTKILVDTQPTNESLSVWSTHLWKESFYLLKSTSPIPDECLLDHFKTHLNPRLLNAYKNNEEIWKTREIKKWTATMVTLESNVNNCYQEFTDFTQTSLKHPNPIPANVSNKHTALSSTPPS